MHVVMLRTQVGWLGWVTFPGLAVLGIKVPLATHGLVCLVDQHAVAFAHQAVKGFHQPLFAPSE
jgi:hypothetical protein